MASKSDSSSSSSQYSSDDEGVGFRGEGEEDIVFGLQPYLFEPRVETSSENLQESQENVFEDLAPNMEEQRLHDTNWCQCNKCTQMPTALECVCCRECTEVVNTINCYNENFEGDVICITDHPGFQAVCLNIWVLEAAYLQYRQQYGRVRGPLNERYRYIAYRQVTRWCWGWLGRRNRVVLPACAVEKIRKRFPPSVGITGFLPPLA